MKWALVSSILFVVAALSGCVSEGGAPKGGSTTSPTGTSSSFTANNTTGPAPTPTTNSTTPTPTTNTTNPPGNGTGNETVGSGAVQHYNFKGAFKAGDHGNDDGKAKAQSKTINVTAGTKQVSAWLRWDDGETGNSPVLVDLDLFLHSTKLELARETLDFEYLRLNKTANFTANPGAWKVEVRPFSVDYDTEWELDVFVWGITPTVKVEKGTKAGVNPGTFAGVALPGSGNNPDYKVTLPAGAQVITARLEWNAGNALATVATRTANDYDLVAKAGGATQASSGNGFGGTEFLFKAATDKAALTAGEWSFTVASFAVVNSEYTLSVEYA